MDRISATSLAMLFVGSLLCGGCGLFSDSGKDSLEQEKQARINANLPFKVVVDGTPAVVSSEICAKVDRPVPDDAELVFDAPNKNVVIISFFPCDKDGIAVSGGKPFVVVVRGTSKTSLADTLDGKPLKPGFHLMRITAGDLNASVLLDVVQSKTAKVESKKTGRK